MRKYFQGDNCMYLQKKIILVHLLLVWVFEVPLATLCSPSYYILVPVDNCIIADGEVSFISQTFYGGNRD
jgi:hypothetical protein